MAVPTPRPVARPTRRGRIVVACSLWMLALGLAAGPLLAEYADQGVEMGIEWLAKWAPNFLQPYLPKPLKASAVLPQASGVARRISAAPVIEAMPATATGARASTPAPAPRPEVAARPVEAKAAPRVPEVIPPEPRGERAQAHKPGATLRHPVALARTESAVRTPGPKPARPSRSETSDPFAGDEGGAKKAVSADRPVKAVEPVAGKSKPARTGDTLEDLMADAASASAPKGRRATSKMDAMLDEVQKSRPAPRPAHVEPESLPPLSASDIARVMAGVKASARSCGARFGQKGVADLKLVVGKDGKVADVAVRGKLAGSPAADCITQVVQGASFPPSSGLKFNYRIDVQ